MKFSLIVLLLLLNLLCGCRGLQSEIQKSQISAAPSTVNVAGTELRLEPELRRVSLGSGFSLMGEIHVLSESGTLPAGTSITHLSLRPSWRGYYVMNFASRNGVWQGGHGNFFGTTKMRNDRLTIDFAWNNLGGGIASKPEHFAAYDVSVTLVDATGKRHHLAKTNVPTR